MSKQIWCIILASVIYGIMPSITKSTTAMLNPQTVIFVGNLAGFLITSTVLWLRRRSVRVTRRQLLHIILFGGLSQACTAALLTSSYQYIQAGVSTMLHFVYPVIVMVLMMGLFGEKGSVKKLLAIACALIGIALIAVRSGGRLDSNPALGMALALLSGVSYGTFVIANDKSAIAELDMFVTLFYVTLTCTVIFGAFSLATGSFVSVATCLPYLMTITNQVGNLCAILLLAAGIRAVGASTAAVLNMLEPAVSMIVSTIAFRERPTPLTLLGCLLIVGAVFVVSGVDTAGRG